MTTPSSRVYYVMLIYVAGVTNLQHDGKVFSWLCESRTM